MTNSNKISRQGQTALIMILLTAAALIFLAITMNWGRVAQTKSLVTIAADEATSLLASDAASYGEMQKQTYLQNKNEISSLNGVIMAIIAVIVAIICLIITITTAGGGSPVWAVLAVVLAVLSVVMALVNLALQICVVQPGITALWNKMQKEQTIQQQFVEGGISTALQGSVTDQVNITDYFDLNTNGNFGSTNGFANDTVGRFAFFYTDRLRMLNQTDVPEITFFRQQLDDFINGETCGENAKENGATPSMGINFNCSDIGAGKECLDIGNSDPACESPIPDSLQLNDTCTDSSPSSPSYNPSCDVCCQPLVINSTPADPTATYQSIRPTSCYPYSNGGSYPGICFSKPNKSECNLTKLCASTPNDPSCLFGGSSSPAECSTNNPYDSINPPKTYPYIYDASYQEYSNQASFLDQYGRDRRYAIPPGEPPFSSLILQGEFPNGIYPYFWLLKNYALEVDTLTTVGFPPKSTSQALHWCSAATSGINGINIDSFTAPSGFSDINQLTLSYACQSQDCCVNYLPDSLNQNAVNSNSIALTSTAGVMNVAITKVIVTLAVGSPVTYTNPTSFTATDDAQSVEFDITATETGGTIQAVTFNNRGGNSTALTAPQYAFIVKAPLKDGAFSVTATATDGNGNTMTSSPVSVTIAAVSAPAPSPQAQASPAVQAKAKPVPAPAAFAQPADSQPITITVTGSSYTVIGGVYTGSGPVTIAATVTGSILAQIAFYAQNTSDDSVLSLGTVNNGPPLLSNWNPQIDWTPPGGSYTIFAVGSSTGSVEGVPSSGITVNGNIDIVGNPTLVTNPKTASPIANPVSDGTWGYNPSLNDTWNEGDNQMCVPDWPYNGSSLAYDDGSCEWTGTPPPAPGMILTEKTTPKSTIDRVDDVMHTLSDFDVFAGSVLSKDEETLNKTFDAWYPQASQWIAPSCDAPTATPSCSQTDFDNPVNQNCGPGFNPACNPYCADMAAAAAVADTACHKGGDGRLLSIYAPVGYPGVSMATPYSGSTDLDRLKDWNNLITGWLNNAYANDSAWCVPTQTTLQTKASNDTCPDGTVCPWSGTCNDVNKTACTPSEISYINAKSFTTQWGDLPHVIACLNYNAGPVSTPASNYQQCLSELQTGTCPTVLPQDCPPTYDKSTACNVNAGGYASWLSNNSNLATNPLYQQCLTALTSASPCPDSLPPVCEPLGTAPVNTWNSAAPSKWPSRCDVYRQGSYANWVSDQINYGPIYNYTNCATLLANSCPANATVLNDSVCAPAVLGRTFEPTTPTFSGVDRCKPTVAGSYAHWIQDNITLFTDEQPKFLARSSFLTDLYSRAQTMQSIFVQADAGLHSFLKPCLGCAYVTACPSSGTCSDGSLCGPPSCADGSMCMNGECNDGTPCLPAGQCAMTSACSAGKCADGSACGAANCADGGPAARLIYRRLAGNPTNFLPNAVIYGWTDNVPTGRMGGCTDNGQNAGCAHIVKVSAYSPGRNGNASFVFNILPWINTWETTFLRKYALANRDGYVYVGVRRWDQDHAGTGYFNNGGTMWNFIYHNPSTGAEGTGGLPTSCMGVPLGGVGSCSGGPGCLGYGLMQNTAAGLKFAQISSQDQTALGNAYMLNDNGNGHVDAYLGSATSCQSGGGSAYCTCLSDSNKLLNSGVESHACAEYIASTNASGPSGNDDGDYSLKFVDCNQLGHPEDLTYTSS